MDGQIIVPGFGDMTQDVIRELTSGRLFTAVRARQEQQAIAREEAHVGQRHHLKCGRLRLRVSEEAYFYWGERLGYACWKDRGFLREFERDNPEARVKSAPRACTLRVQGRKAEGGRLKTEKGQALARGVILDGTGAPCLPANSAGGSS